MTRPFVVICLLLTANIFAQQVSIPDPAWEQQLIDQFIDTDGIVNGSVAQSDVASLTLLNITGAAITDVTGINAFASVDQINIIGTSVTSVDIDGLSQLGTLLIFDTPLSQLQITNTPVFQLGLGNTSMTNLNFADYPTVHWINLGDNPLLQSVDISSTSFLTTFSVGDMPGTVVLPPTLNNTVFDFTFINTGDVELDFTAFSDITNLFVADMPLLQKVNMANGNQTGFTDVDIFINPQLSCVVVDDVTYATNNFNVDMPSALTTDPNCTTVGFEDERLPRFVVYPNPTADTIRVLGEPVMAYSLHSLSGQQVATGKGNVISLQELPAGIYLLELEQIDGNIVHKRVVRE